MIKKQNLPGFEKFNDFKEDIELYLYVDEMKKIKNCFGQLWTYICIVVIEEKYKKDLFGKMMEERKTEDYYHELHFRNINKSCSLSNMTRLAKRWINIVLSENIMRKVRFHILGINLLNLHYSSFGDKKKQERNIYNRFFRSNILSCLNYFFPQYNKIVIKNILHDRNELEIDEIFDWHTIWFIERTQEKVSFDEKNIIFIDSDHNKEKKFPDESHFIQLSDLILGATSQCLDAANEREGSIEIGEIFLPLIERLNDESRINNQNSRYDYYRKCAISFFPKIRLSEDELQNGYERHRSGFYKNRKIILKDKLIGQLCLFNLA